MDQKNEETGISRRTAICALSLIGVGVFTSAESAVAASGVKVLANGKVEVTLKSNPALKKVGGVVRVDDVIRTFNRTCSNFCNGLHRS